MSAFSKIFGSHSERELKRIYPIADKVESYKEAMGKLSDEELKDKTREFKKRLEDGATLDDILPEAFATVREAAKRTIGLRHFRVQLIGGVILHQGRITEMRTGEGKTLVSTLPAYLNALEGKGVHIVTVNDYLAKRDAEWMGQIHEFLGLKVGVILNSMGNDERREAYNCDITYATNNELGFDYLRDNMVIYKEKLVLRGLHYQKHFPQGKLVRAIRGTVFDVAVDLRTNSKTYGKWFGVELSAENKKQFYIPEGFAHGFIVLSDEAEFAYKCTDFYHPGDEGGLAWNDPEIGVDWPIEEGMKLIISEKDQKWGGLKDTFKFE